MRPAALFVYGTLRRGSKIKIARLFHANAEFLGTGRMQGRLERSYPHRGVVRSGKPGEWISGEVFQLNDASKLLPILDEYEGPEYKRTSVPVQLDSGRRLRAWMYLLKC
ncbi:MAG TPA: gamma-glutamylcyclotransferase family protein [Bryobacteraceae bacterium]|jgi:gamma-glutamylcyclotransferase (GGCT)/AIG2-like uncharacterized protein YtfP|nr:gamma-glutamylcyclotransferase family protein [Bryobacteraceae bacterium]